ncbi:hypothetical protein ABBQ38_003210 [Trebouxia sp. C0009 RCD-2024]
MTGHKTDRATTAVLRMAEVEASKRNPTINRFDLLGGEDDEATLNDQSHKIKAYDHAVREKKRIAMRTALEAKEKRRLGRETGLDKAKAKLLQVRPDCTLHR